MRDRSLGRQTSPGCLTSGTRSRSGSTRRSSASARPRWESRTLRPAWTAWATGTSGRTEVAATWSIVGTEATIASTSGASVELARVTVPPTLDGASLTMFRRALAAACRDDECRVLVVEGSDSEFCRGLDFAALSEASSGDVGEATHLFARCLTELRSAGMPTIAAVGGATIGGGVGLAAACDMVLASERATFALPELLFGLLPATVLPL